MLGLIECKKGSLFYKWTHCFYNPKYENSLLIFLLTKNKIFMYDECNWLVEKIYSIFNIYLRRKLKNKLMKEGGTKLIE